VTALPHDPFDALRLPDGPVAPRAAFAGELRRRLHAALTTQEEQMSTTTAPATETTALPSTLPASRPRLVTPYLVIDGAAAAIDFYVAAFGAVEHHRMVGDDGRVGHAELLIGASRLMLADEYPEHGILGPTSRGGTSVSFTLEVTDVDAMFAEAVRRGAREVRPVADQFYGYRQGTLVDPWGHQWSLSTPVAGTFDDDTYAANSAEQGYEVRQAAGAADPQLKHHEPGDLYYFTLPTTDLERAQRFFSAVLGWRFHDDTSGHASNISAPPGGVQPGSQGAQLWFVVDDIHDAVARVREHGGTASEPVQSESGWSADCTDDQGTAFSISVPAPHYTI
jgi:uncharacterized glyoxalase superfamily protein PhnB